MNTDPAAEMVKHGNTVRERAKSGKSQTSKEKRNPKGDRNIAGARGRVLDCCQQESAGTRAEEEPSHKRSVRYCVGSTLKE